MSSYQDQINELTQENEFLKSAATLEGFCRLYFGELPNHVTRVEAFNAVNDRYFDLIGDYRYSDYNTFQTIISRATRNGKLKPNDY